MTRVEDGHARRSNLSRMPAPEVLFPTPVGVAPCRSHSSPRPPVALVVLGHGAGGDVDAPDLLTVRDAALALDIAVVRVRQPYRRPAGGRPRPQPSSTSPRGGAGRPRRRRGDRQGRPPACPGSSAGAAAVAGWPPGSRPRQAEVVAACWRWRSRSSRPAGRVSRLDELLAVPVPSGPAGRRDPFGSAERSRAAVGEGGQVARSRRRPLLPDPASGRDHHPAGARRRWAAAVTPWLAGLAGPSKPVKKARRGRESQGQERMFTTQKPFLALPGPMNR